MFVEDINTKHIQVLQFPKVKQSKIKGEEYSERRCTIQVYKTQPKVI